MLRFFYVEDRMLKRHISIGLFVIYIYTGSSIPISPSKSCDLADENKKKLMEWTWFETTVLPLFTGESYCWTFKPIIWLEERSQSRID